MKITVEIPDPILRRARAFAAECGISYRALVSEALADKLRAHRRQAGKPWMDSFGKLRALHTETAKISRIIEEEFGQIEAWDRD
jgi:hypothetical protein